MTPCQSDESDPTGSDTRACGSDGESENENDNDNAGDEQAGDDQTGEP